MKASSNLTITQLVERIDELEDLSLKVTHEFLTKRLKELKSQYNHRNQPNYNMGVINPLPPDSIDLQNKSVITPKSPDQVEREHKEWLHRQQV